MLDSISNMEFPSCPFLAAHHSGVRLFRSFASTLAAFSRSCRTAPSYPFAAACNSGVQPSRSLASTVAPFSRAAVQLPHTPSQQLLLVASS
jgi:hypothetical protein